LGITGRFSSSGGVVSTARRFFSSVKTRIYADVGLAWDVPNIKETMFFDCYF
jgi:hypothetical protein